MASFALSIVHTLADLICPERCAACTAIVPDGGIFCHGCRGFVNVLDPPKRSRRDGPAVHSLRERTETNRPIRSLRSWASYRTGRPREPVVQALTSFKYGNNTRLARRMALAMADRVADASLDVILPVPLHPTRLRQRGFNQSALLARHLGRRLAVPVDYDALHRVRDAPSQTGAGAAERRARVRRAFRVTRPQRLRARRVLLVDDVVTSGATVRAAAHALQHAGVRTVDVLTFARADIRVASPRDREYGRAP